MILTDEIRSELRERWAKMRLLPDRETILNWYTGKIIGNKMRYQFVERRTQFPWYFVGILHGLEASFDIRCWLANGDSLREPTTRVPKGLQCDGTWENGAIVSLENKWPKGVALHTIEEMLFAFEAYNGFGYRQRGMPSPYVWSFTDQYMRGKYTKDGKFDENAVSEQCGCAAILKRLIEIQEVKGFENETDLPF